MLHALGISVGVGRYQVYGGKKKWEKNRNADEIVGEKKRFFFWSSDQSMFSQCLHSIFMISMTYMYWPWPRKVESGKCAHGVHDRHPPKIMVFDQANTPKYGFQPANLIQPFFPPKCNGFQPATLFIFILAGGVGVYDRHPLAVRTFHFQLFVA